MQLSTPTPSIFELRSARFAFRICRRCCCGTVIPVKPAAILFDLDDTLLVNSMDTFVPAYLGALTEFMSELVMPRWM